MKPLSLAFLGACIALPVAAQTVPPPFTTSGAVPTITQWTNAWAGKLDAPLTAGTTPTSGFTAGQLLMSDGTVTQAAGAGKVTSLALGGLPLYIFGYNNVHNIISLSTVAPSDNYSGIGFWLDAGQWGINIGGTAGNNVFFGFSSNGYLSSSPDVAFMRGGAAQAVFRDLANTTAAESLRVYNTYTDASNGEWGALDWQTTPNVLTIGTQANGTGTARPVQFTSNGSVGFNLDASLTGLMNVFRNIQTVGFNLAYGFISNGTQPTIAGCTAGTKVGGATAGTFQLGAACAAAATLVFTGMPATNNGYACDATNRNIPAMLAQQTASTATGFTLTVAGTSGASGNVVQWKCIGY